MTKQKTEARSNAVAMDMTPMIDVVFQLLIFFLVTIKPLEIIGRFEVSRPQALREAPVIQPPMLWVAVHQNGRFMLNQRWMSISALGQNLKLVADRDKTQTVLIQCSENSGHGSLVSVLDLCAKVGLTKVSVVTMPPTVGT